MARQKRVFSPEFREDAVKLVIETSRPVAQVARELITWVVQASEPVRLLITTPTMSGNSGQAPIGRTAPRSHRRTPPRSVRCSTPWRISTSSRPPKSASPSRSSMSTGPPPKMPNTA
jgi:hypothetical protein